MLILMTYLSSVWGQRVLDRNKNVISVCLQIFTDALEDAKATEIVVKGMDFVARLGLNPSSSIYQ